MPATWGLRLLRQILDELVPGVEQFLLVDDVVASKMARLFCPVRSMATRYVRANQVAGGGAAAIVEETGRTPAAWQAVRQPAADGDSALSMFHDGFR